MPAFSERHGATRTCDLDNNLPYWRRSSVRVCGRLALMPPTPPYFSTPNERRAAIPGLLYGWLVIALYLALLVSNVVGAMRAGASGSLLVRAFAPPGSDLAAPALPWIEAIVALFALALLA